MSAISDLRASSCYALPKFFVRMSYCERRELLSKYKTLIQILKTVLDFEFFSEETYLFHTLQNKFTVL